MRNLTKARLVLCLVVALALATSVRCSYLQVEGFLSLDCSGDAYSLELVPIGKCMGDDSVYQKYTVQNGVVTQLSECTNSLCTADCQETQFELDLCHENYRLTIIDTELQSLQSDDYIQYSYNDDVYNCAGTTGVIYATKNYPCTNFDGLYQQAGVNGQYYEFRTGCTDDQCTEQCVSSSMLLDGCLYGFQYSISDESTYESNKLLDEITVEVYDSADCSDSPTQSYQVSVGYCQGGGLVNSILEIEDAYLNMYYQCQEQDCSTGCKIKTMRFDECYEGFKFSYPGISSDSYDSSDSSTTHSSSPRIVLGAIFVLLFVI